ncbi:hypothetical protein SASPL_129161 [Salvia splendens]|uniref:Myb/SANT-like domain-containing protein n=1 Tax=Salvia splendens TaxID=180675 RepID=A0A8X8ZN77_SALSN|nr:hypothetical protein SASPL_129161 [Salvia splendens]
MASQQMGGSDDEGSNELGRNKTIISDRSRRVWSVREEEILMATLKELTANGWRCDNGCRAGYLTRIKEAIKREFPNTDICPHPHIYSKMTTWKRNYGSLKMMLNHSGIGFNSDGQYKIECDDEQWAQFVKLIDLGDAVQKIFGNKVDIPDEAGTSHPMTFEELFPDEAFPPGVLPEMIDESQSTTEGAAAAAGSNSRAGAGSGSGAGVGAGSGSGAVTGAGSGLGVVAGSGSGHVLLMWQLQSQIHTDTNDRLKEISTRIGYDFDLSTKRTEVFDQLKDIPGLTLKQQFYISKKLVKESELLDLFRGLQVIARGAFVFDLLEIDGML